MPTCNSANFNQAATWNGVNGNLTTVGSNGSPSYYGTYDQNGNLFEWNDSIIGSSRGIRGGSWLDTVSNLASTYRGSFNPAANFSTVGFRISTIDNEYSYSNFVNVGNASNTNDVTGYGGVGYSYLIGTYLITNS